MVGDIFLNLMRLLSFPNYPVVFEAIQPHKYTSSLTNKSRIPSFHGQHEMIFPLYQLFTDIFFAGVGSAGYLVIRVL